MTLWQLSEIILSHIKVWWVPAVVVGFYSVVFVINFFERDRP